MCGIVGYVGQKDGCNLIVEGLRALEYRGYDSAGIAATDGVALSLRKSVGKLSALDAVLAADPLMLTTGIGHIRWATHGIPSRQNAHPHIYEQIAVVHNGIIENYQALRQALTAQGHAFMTETDTETVPHLIATHLAEGQSFLEALKSTVKRLKGAYALGILDGRDKSRIYMVRNGAPLVVGHGNGTMMLGSDAHALADFTTEFTYLEEGDYGYITAQGLTLYNLQDQPVERPKKLIHFTENKRDKGQFEHYMMRDIWDQPVAIERTKGLYLDGTVLASIDWKSVSHLTLLACGASYYAAYVAKYWIESMARVAVTVEIASEFRYRNPVLPPESLVIGISQSGETADTLAALKQAQSFGNRTVCIVNARETSMERLTDLAFLTEAGREIGVASTKTFTAQLTVFAMITLALLEAKQLRSTAEIQQIMLAFGEVPALVQEFLAKDESVKRIAKALQHASSVLFVARDAMFPIALEGALKLKELAYLHAEATPAGEFKHGPLAMVDETVPIILLAPSGPHLSKALSNAEEIAARGGQIYVIGDAESLPSFAALAKDTVTMPRTPSLLQPILYALPMQLLGYHVAHCLGKDIDQPRNLAKSVTVE